MYRTVQLEDMMMNTVSSVWDVRFVRSLRNCFIRRFSHVTFRINDINDNAPAFAAFDWPVQLSEGAAPGTQAATIRIPKALDADDGANGSRLYCIQY